jgi:hypothetical protein
MLKKYIFPFSATFSDKCVPSGGEGAIFDFLLEIQKAALCD